VLAAAVFVEHGLSSSAAAPKGPVPLAAVSGLTPVNGDQYVVYHSGRDASARLHGTVTHATPGEVARLYAQPFPYDHAPAPAGFVVLAGGSYTFTVTPSVATRYHVDLFPGRVVIGPPTRSKTLTLYVVRDVVHAALPPCQRVLCEPVIHLHVFVPSSAMGPELRKRWLTYSGLTEAKQTELKPTGAGPTGVTPPRRLVLGQGHPKVGPPQRISATEYGVTIAYLFAVIPGSYSFRFKACAPDTEAGDGLGLPGRHGCGAKAVTVPGGYLG
jgi:hypothetical protein